MSKNKMNPGIEYLLSLGITPANSHGDLRRRLEKATDRNTLRKIMSAIHGRGDSRLNDDTTFYPLKNTTLKLSLALSAAYDGDILKKACNWILNHKDAFGGSILEIGCDCGIMSCFLAKTFPDCKITAIDRCQEGVNNAIQLANNLGIKNVRFICADVKDIEEQFDTVFSMRTMHENHSDHDEEDRSNELEEQARLFQKSLSGYAHILNARLNEDGLLVSIERIGRNALLLGWMYALEEAGLTFDLDEYEELTCNEVGETSTFEAFISYKTEEKTASAHELFMAACTKYMDFSLAQYGAWDAKIIFDWKRGELIEGYIIEDTIAHTKNKMSIWTHKYDETGMLVYQNNNGTVYAGFYDISLKEDQIKSIRESIDEAKKYEWLKITKM